MTRRVPSWVGDRPTGRPPRPPVRRPDEWDSGPVGRSSRAQASATRMAAYGLWGAIGLALVLGLVNCAGTPAAAPDDEPSTTAAEPAAPPGGCAELAVAAWLAGDTALLSGLPDAARARPERGRRRADLTYTLSATQADPDRWVYLVAAQVSERESSEDRWQSAGTQFYTVTLAPAVDGCGGWAPAALPARVTPPALVTEGAADYSIGLPTSGTPLTETLAAFFTALLTGTGELERYTAPGVTIAGFDPAPYPYVELIDVRAHAGTPLDRSAYVPADGTTARVLVTVATDPDGTDLPLSYPVTVTVRGGRWEVVAIDSVPSPTTASPQPGRTP